MHRNALRDLHMPPDAKTQVRHNFSRCVFYENCISPTRALKIVRRHFTPRTHRNALPDTHIPLDPKTQVWCNVSQRTFSELCIGPTRARKLVC
jgi:hypothetical protein